MAAPTIPTPVLGGLIGLTAFILYRIIKGTASKFTMVKNVQFWHQGEADALRAALEAAHVAPTVDAGTGQPIERVMTVLPGAAGGENALAWVKKVQAQKHVVTSSVNLLDKSAMKRLIADVLPAEEATLATGTELAVLPVL